MKHQSRLGLRFMAPAFWGIAIGGMTFAVGPLSLRSEHSALAALQVALLALILPGLIAAGALAGNIHAFPLGPAAVINALLQFGVFFLLLRLIRYFIARMKVGMAVGQPPTASGG